MNFYRNESSNPKWNAQRNLDGRTHYVSDDTLRYHKSRVLRSHVVSDGFIFTIVESYAVDYPVNHGNGKRAFRGVAFDVFGNTLYRPDLDAGFTSAEKASEAMRVALESVDAVAVTLAAVYMAEKHAIEEFKDMRKEINKR